MSVILHQGDCLDVLKTLPDSSVDSIVTDPPYGLEFMGRDWDGADGFRRSLNAADTGRDNTFGRLSRKGPEYRAGHLFQEWSEAWASEAIRVLKPGGHMLAFSGTRTYHRMVVAIEDAGFEIRDQIGWMYGQGFPKSLNVSKAIDNKTHGAEPTETAKWDGWGTALKPAWEPICMARKPFPGTVAANVLEHGCGALNIDASRVETEESLNGGAYAKSGQDRHDGAENWRYKRDGDAGVYKQPSGRWPANVIHDGSDEVLEAFPHSGSGNNKGAYSYAGREYQNADTSMFNGDKPQAPSNYNDTGSAARFFYAAKASKADRAGSKHPTVKPVALMRYLCKLVTPKGGIVLDPFAGTGTTGEAAVFEGFSAILIERETEYCDDIRRRLAMFLNG